MVSLATQLVDLIGLIKGPIPNFSFLGTLKEFILLVPGGVGVGNLVITNSYLAHLDVGLAELVKK